MISAETASIKYEYTYDDRGNILTKKEYSISLDENNQKVYTLIEANTDTYGYDETWKDKLISYNGQSVSYDAVGNPINYMGNELTWTMGRQLATFGDISYTYNESGIRTSKTSNGVTTKFYLDGTNIIEQTDGTTTLYFFYDSIGEVVGFMYNGNNYIYVKNSMGDIVGIADSAGNLITSYTYDAWGKVTSVTGSNITIGDLNPFRYRSYYYDSDIELYYLQSRYYDAEIGRFINSDDVHYLGITETDVSYNAFAYCENDPVCSVDSNGYRVAKYINSTYCLYVYYYDIKTVSPMGHVDVSLDGENIYSYGTYNGNGGGAALKKYKYNAKTGGYFGKYTKCVKIKMTYEEYIACQTYVSCCFLLYTVGSPYEGGTAPNKIYEYKVVRGQYENYVITKCNCSTFVADVLTAVFPNKIKKVSIIYRKLTMIPYFTYLIAQKLSKEV